MERGIPQEHLDLILGYEELEGDEKARADELLRNDPQLAERLAWHRRLEAEAAQVLPSGRGLFDPDELSDDEIRRQQESLRRVLLRATAQAAGIRPATRPLWKRTAQWALPLAAVLALVLIWPQTRAPREQVHGLRLVAGPLVEDVRGGDPDPNTLHTGQAFAIEFELEADAHVVIFHLDPAGRFAQVHPDPTVAAAVFLPAGKHQVPSADASSMWVLDGEAGLETFFVAGVAQSPTRFALAFDGPPTDRRARVETIEKQLRERFDSVQVHEFVHAD